MLSYLPWATSWSSRGFENVSTGSRTIFLLDGTAGRPVPGAARGERTVQREVHITLSRAEENLAERDAPQDRSSARARNHRNRVAAAWWEWRQHRLPAHGAATGGRAEVAALLALGPVL